MPVADSTTPATQPTLPALDPGSVTITWEQTQQWLVTVGLRILLTVVLAVVALWLLRRVIDRVVATMTSKSARRLAESGRAGKGLATAGGMGGERQKALWRAGVDEGNHACPLLADLAAWHLRPK